MSLVWFVDIIFSHSILGLLYLENDYICLLCLLIVVSELEKRSITDVICP